MTKAGITSKRVLGQTTNMIIDGQISNIDVIC